MPNYRLVIIDTDTRLVNQLTEFMNRNPGLNVIGTADDGICALNLIQSLQPDIVLMDPLLPGMDGISLIKALQKMKNTPIIICMSRFYTTTCIEMARKNGASYYLYKPISHSALKDIIIECARLTFAERKSDLERADLSNNSDLLRRIHSILRELGFSFRYCGSNYIASSVAIAYESPMALHNLSSGVYRKLAKTANVSEACIERSIRTAISHANLSQLLEERIGQIPTNKNCIRYILHELHSSE